MKLLRNLLYLLLLITLNHGYAQQDGSAPPSSEEAAGDSVNDATTASSAEKVPPAVSTQAVLPSKRADKNRVFKPSEEISEDIAVPFPVDI